MYSRSGIPGSPGDPGDCPGRFFSNLNLGNPGVSAGSAVDQFCRFPQPRSGTEWTSYLRAKNSKWSPYTP
eukprot:942006-Prorocentrum_minimum.AAC.1